MHIKCPTVAGAIVGPVVEMQTVRANALAGDPRAPVSALALRRALALTSVTLTPVDLPSVGVVLTLEHGNSKYPPIWPRRVVGALLPNGKKNNGGGGAHAPNFPIRAAGPTPNGIILTLNGTTIEPTANCTYACTCVLVHLCTCISSTGPQ